MLTLDPHKLPNLEIPIATGWLLGACMEARGKQDLWIRQKPEVLEALREQTTIQSAESSNRIEGVTVEANRLRPLVIGRARPRDRSEEEVAGYRAALDWILSRKKPLAVTPDVIRRLHALAQSSGDSGEWKQRNNEIVEILPDGERKVRFVPATAKDTPKLIDTLCRSYRAVAGEERIPPLLTVATFVFDFLCIHPFRDGNGRVSRLVNTLLLEAQEVHVVRYISLERLIEESKAEYYDVLNLCSSGWHEGRNEIVPWWNYFLGTLRRAYKEFEQQVESAGPRPAKSDLVRRTVLGQSEPFTLADIMAQLPSVSSQLIKKVLAKMKDADELTLKGRGRGAQWIIK